MRPPVTRQAGNADGHRDPVANERSEGVVRARWHAVEHPSELVATCDALPAKPSLDDGASDVSWSPPRLVLRQPSRCEVPRAFVPHPPDDRDLAAEPEDVEHPPDPFAVVPATGPPRHGRAVLEVAREKRPTPPDLAQDVSAERGVGSEPLADVACPCAVAARVPPHRLAVDSVVGRRDDVRPVLEEIAPLERALELGDVVRPQPAEQDHPLGPRDRGDRIDLNGAERAHDLRHRLWRPAVQELSRDREPPRLGERELDHRRTVSRPITRRSRSSALSNAVSSEVEARTPSSRWKALTTSSPLARSDFRSARPTIRSRQRSGST